MATYGGSEHKTELYLYMYVHWLQLTIMQVHVHTHLLLIRGRNFPSSTPLSYKWNRLPPETVSQVQHDLLLTKTIYFTIIGTQEYYEKASKGMNFNVCLAVLF